MCQPRPWHTSGAAVLSVKELRDVQLDPLFKLSFELADLFCGPDVVW